ncbi:hypothetical protein FO519_003589 [Halicephalobus sp. NKZ332]|nr:hypothetical protein FO519_003589 [Halicephalobus sp. NKZ332]
MRVLNVKWLIVIPIIGVFFIVLGGVIHWIVTPMVLSKITDMDYIGYDKDGKYNEMTKSWANPLYDMKLEIYLFNLMNPIEVVNGSRPKLVEKGPYTFMESQSKDFNISKSGERILYRNKHLYFFNQSASCPTCFLNDTVTIPNILLQKLVDYANSSSILRIVIEEAAILEQETAFITVKVGDLLFDGYKDKLVSAICGKAIVKSICKAIGIPERIGIFYGQNNTDDGLYEINTGLKDRSLLGNLYSWNNMTRLPDSVWYGPRARAIHGNDGQLFKPFLKKNEVQQLFVAQVCRVVEMEVQQESEFHNIAVYEYGPAASMNNITLQRELGFCNPAAPRFFNDTVIQPIGCSPVGLMDVSSCIPGNARIYISQPFFYNCPAALHEAIDGIRRSTENDRTFVQIQPEAGVVIRAIRKSQLNVGVIKGKISFLSQMKDTIIPLLWLNESAVFDPQTESMISELGTILKVLPAAMIFFGGVGGFLFLAGIATIVVSMYFKETDVPLLEDDEEDDQSQNEVTAGQD